MGYVLIIGSKSDIAKALADKYAQAGFNLYLAARNSTQQESFATDLKIRHKINVECMDFDVIDYSSHESFYEGLAEKPVGLILVAGYLGDQDTAQTDFEESQRIIDTNYTGLVSLTNIVANDFEHKGEGFIVGVGSVAGDRGRKSNYIYGSAKGALATYLSGLRNRLYEHNVQVLTVKPGFVNTAMTAGMDLPGALTAEPEEVANDIFKAQQAKKNVIFTKWHWRWVMKIITSIPEFLFKRLSI